MHTSRTVSSKPMLHILSLTSNDLGTSYGPAVHYLELWNAVSELGHNVSIEGIAPSWSGLPPIVEPAFALRQYPVAIPRVRQAVWDLICAVRLIFTQADIIYVRVSSFHIATICALQIRRKLSVAVELNGSAGADATSRGHRGPMRSIAAYCERSLIKRAQLVFSVTSKLKAYAEHINPRATHVHVDNGVSNRFLLPRAPEYEDKSPRTLTGIYVGTFTAWDGASTIKKLANRFPEISFLMIGDGGRRAEVERDAPPNMKFLGWIDYRFLPEYYRQADFAIVLYELKRHDEIGSSPLKLREYMASGLPIFTTIADGTEAVSTYGIGFRSENGNAEDFSRFISALRSFRARYTEVRNQLLAEISWARSAEITFEALRKLACRR